VGASGRRGPAGNAGGRIDPSGRLDYELEDYTDHRWWPVPELITSGERF
jgi:hypothetical protein